MPSDYRFIHEAFFWQHYSAIIEFFKGADIQNIYVPDYQHVLYFDRPSSPDKQAGKTAAIPRSPVFVIGGRQYVLGTDRLYLSEGESPATTETGRDEDGFSLDSVPFSVYPVREPYDFSIDNWCYDSREGHYLSFQWVSKMPWKDQTVRDVVPYYRQDFRDDSIVGFSLELPSYRISFPFPPDDSKDLEYMGLINAPGPLYHRKYLSRIHFRKLFSDIEEWVFSQVPESERAELTQEEALPDFFRNEDILQDGGLRDLFSSRKLGLAYDPAPDEECMRKVFGQLQTGGIPCNVRTLKKFYALSCGKNPQCEGCIARDRCARGIDNDLSSMI